MALTTMARMTIRAQGLTIAELTTLAVAIADAAHAADHTMTVIVRANFGGRLPAWIAGRKTMTIERKAISPDDPDRR